ncbi:MAG: Trp biosynthesis-associated membrane protein [Micrococcales bacterium]|nr:Trp biosynthesis-associated membrane protein [Micrococcales bacterium]
MTPSRLRGMLLAATALLAALVFLAWSQPWFTLELTASSGDPVPLEVRGDVAAAALPPLALALLAIVAALALAGPALRTVFGVLEALLGGCVVAVTAVALGAPVAASASAVTEVTGVGGSESVAELVASVRVSAWPAVAIAVGVLVVVAGLSVALTARRWPASGRRYSRTRIEAVGPAASDPIAEWDALSDGDDPTAPSR